MIYNNSIKSYIINTKERRQRKIACDKTLRRLRLKSDYFIQPLHSNPIEGNKNSHISLIKKCKEEGLESVLILEDDFRIVGSLSTLPDMPEKWDILYLGGEVLRKLEPIKEGWVRCISKRHHAYVINLKNDEMIDEICRCLNKKGKKYCDWMAERVQPRFRTYMVNPMRFIQQDGQSDITGKYELYKGMEDSFRSFFVPQHTIKDDMFNLKLPEIMDDDLPKISVVTLVNNCRDIYSLSLRNFEESFYPKDKVEWIVFEETEGDEDRCIKDLLTEVKNLKYVKYNNNGKFDYNKSLDLAMKHCSEDIVLIMDTVGFYSRENILSRVKLLVKYPELMGVGSDKIGYYDIIHKNSYTNKVNDQLFISSLGFRKKLWEERNFSVGNFFEDRIDSFINIPHTFIQYGLILGRDETQKNVGQQLFSYYDTWDIIDQEFMDNLGGYLKRKSKFNEINRQVIN
jgi:hypothetical protein